MVKLVLIEGVSGSGKSTISRYMDRELGFYRLGFDDYINRLRAGTETGFGPVVFQLLYGEDFWLRFWEERGRLPYDLRSAKGVVAQCHMSIAERRLIAGEQRYHLSYALWNEYLGDRDLWLSRDKDVVMEPFIHRAVRKNCFSVYIPGKTLQKYLIRINTDKAVAMARTTERGWDVEKARRSARRRFDFSVPSGEITVLEYGNNKSGDLGGIQEDLKGRFGL